jgi:hypothetical protein
MRTQFPAASVLAVLAVALAAPARGQFQQYVTPGGPQARLDNKREALEKAAEEARFHLGPIRLSPRFSLRDGSWIDEASGPGTPSDYSLTVGGGVRAYLRAGGKVMLTAHALPEYVYWQDLADRRRINQRFGTAFYGYWNRMSLEVEAVRRDEQGIITPELLQPLSAREDRLEATTEILVGASTAVFVQGSVSEHSSLVERDEPSAAARRLSVLDRREEVARAGLRLHRKGGLSLGLGVEGSKVEFAAGALDRSNSGTAPVFEARLDRKQFFVSGEVAARSLHASQGSSFVDYDRVTGGFEIGGRTPKRSEGNVYVNRNMVYSVFPDYSYLTDDRLGAALLVRLGWRTSTRFYVERGQDDYTAFAASTPRRQDDLTSYGASIQLGLGRAGGFTVRAGRTRFDSNLPGFDRTVTTVSASVTWGGDL